MTPLLIRTGLLLALSALLAPAASAQTDGRSNYEVANLIAPPRKPEQSNQRYPGKYYTSVEKLAEFPGGRAKMLDFLAKHIEYPNALDKINYKPGPITVRFIVAPDGTLHNITVDSRAVTNPDAEKGMDLYRISIIRAIEKMPRWRPARMNNMPVAMLYTLPLQVEN
jgi:periplasmic protein TonB